MYILLTLQYENRDFWVHSINKDRHLKGEFFTLYKDLREYPDKFFRWYRMTIEQFDYILEKLRPVLQKDNNNYWDSISPEERLAIMLRYWLSMLYYFVRNKQKQMSKKSEVFINNLKTEPIMIIAYAMHSIKTALMSTDWYKNINEMKSV